MGSRRRDGLPLVEVFYGSILAAASTAIGWRTWERPRNATMVSFTAIGGGAGGGGGFTGSTTLTLRNGGAGGGSGAIARLIIPAFFLPKTLFLLPGAGGAGGLVNTDGIAGGRSFITDKINTAGTAANTVLVSGAVAAAAANAGGASSNAGGVGETVATNLLGIYQGLGLWTAVGGMTGSSGGDGGPTPIVFGGSGLPLCGGTGGGGIDASNAIGASGDITGAGRIPTQSGMAAASGSNGTAGVHLEQPWMGTGGIGGGSSNGGQCGNGGAGAPGCGGGGGGSGGTGGVGGNGGPGVIVIVSW